MDRGAAAKVGSVSKSALPLDAPRPRQKLESPGFLAVPPASCRRCCVPAIDDTSIGWSHLIPVKAIPSYEVSSISLLGRSTLESAAPRSP
jgi:hypothetical protein